MKPIFAILLSLLLLIINGCSDQKRTSEADKKDHVLREQIDMVNDANVVTDSLNRDIKAQDSQAQQLTGH